MLKLVYLPSRLALENGLYPKQLRTDTVYKTKVLVYQTCSCTRLAKGFINNRILETPSSQIFNSLYHFFCSLHTTALQHYTHTIQLTYLESVEVQQTGCWSLRTLASVPGGFSRLLIVARPETGPRVSQRNVKGRRTKDDKLLRHKAQTFRSDNLLRVHWVMFVKNFVTGTGHTNSGQTNSYWPEFV